MVVFYWLGTLVFLPLSDFSGLPGLTGWQWALLLFCGANTLIAYGCFAEALEHWEASRVSATVTLAPLITVGMVQLIPMGGIEARETGGMVCTLSMGARGGRCDRHRSEGARGGNCRRGGARAY